MVGSETLPTSSILALERTEPRNNIRQAVHAFCAQTVLKSLPLDQGVDAQALTGKVMRGPIPFFFHAYNFI